MHSFLQDLRHGARLLLRTPGFTVVAVLTLALGSGANTAVFTMVRSALFSMFGPVPEPSRVERIWASNLITGTPRMPMSMPDFESIRGQSRSFTGVAAWNTASWFLDFVHGPVRVTGARVSSDFFSVLDAKPALGRGFAADGSNERLTAIISDRLWRQYYASHPAVLSRSLDIDGLSYTIVGVMPQTFWYQARDIDVWIPLAEPAAGWNRVERAYMVFGRLQPGVTEKQAEAELAALAQRLAAEFPTSNHGWSFAPVSLWHEQMKRLGMTGIFLFAPVLFVLLIACANVGTMLLARASVRQGEIAVRAALGGSRARLVRQLLTESLLLSLGGAVAGFAVAVGAIRLLIAFEPEARAAGASSLFHVDFAMFAFALGVALLTCILFGLSPALAATKVDLNAALKEREGSAGASRTKQLSRERLIAWQVGLAVIFVVITAAFGRGISRIEKTAAHAGFESRNLITFDITPAIARFAKPEQLAAYYSDLQQRIESVPGVQATGASNFLPLLHRPGTMSVTLDPAPPTSDLKPFAVHASVTPGFFETARIPVRRGRTIGQQDTPKSLPVACVNETFARRYSPNQDVLGKHVRIGADGPWLTIVGVIADTLDDPILDTTSPHIFVPQAQSPMRTLVFTVRP
ncbi:MAG TPA: ABC transporter permease, partial [Terriglobia bacterium]|nr:ABC transporter permease [Terriglobia bacterium]